MILHDLLTAATSSGLTVHVVSGWETRGHGDFAAVRGVVCHHTAGPKAGNMPSLDVVTRGRAGLAGPLCNLALARDGSVYVVAAGFAYHAGVGSGYGLPVNDANRYTIGIEAESTGRGDWTPAQLVAYPRLCRALADHYRFPVAMVIGHYEWTPRKIDPYGWPGGMPGLRRSAAIATMSGDDVPTQTLTGNGGAGTPLAIGEQRTLTVNGTGVSMVKAPAGGCRVQGVVTVYLDRPADSVITLEVYTAAIVGDKGVARAGDGAADFPAGTTRLRYPVAMTMRPGELLRVRAAVLGGTVAPTVLKTGFNLDVRS